MATKVAATWAVLGGVTVTDAVDAALVPSASLTLTLKVNVLLAVTLGHISWRGRSTGDTGSTSVIEAIIHNLYEGILDPLAWDRAFMAIADQFGGSAAFLFALNPVSGEVLRDENHRGDPAVLDAYRRYWSYHDERLQLASTIPVGQPMTERTLLPHSEWRRAAILNEFLIPADVPPRHCGLNFFSNHRSSE
jgi:hypothetical protein